MADGRPGATWWRTIGWAAYLACSWTWCIGMYLPVLLLRDFGWWSFAVFALPNCFGAAAMGWLLRNPGDSERLVGAHSLACRVFSDATIAFQVFFLLLILPRLTTAPAWLLGVVPVALGAAFIAGRPRTRLLGTLLTLLISLGCAGWFLAEAPVLPADLPTPRLDPLHLAALAPVCMLGFALCPYLDLTFHRARRDHRGIAGSAAFAIGFLVVFPLMIAFTLLYAIRAVALDAGEPWRAIATPAVLHLCVQLWLTIWLHGTSEDVARESGSPRRTPALRASAVGFIAAPFIWKAARGLGLLPDSYHALSIDEVAYRCFMALYGLVFPAYVYLCILSRRGVRPAPGKQDLAVLAGAVLLASPCYWMGFIERRTWWLLPGVAIVLLAKPLTTRPAAGASPAPATPSP